MPLDIDTIAVTNTDIICLAERYIGMIPDDYHPKFSRQYRVFRNKLLNVINADVVLGNHNIQYYSVLIMQLDAMLDVDGLLDI